MEVFHCLAKGFEVCYYATILVLWLNIKYPKYTQ